MDHSFPGSSVHGIFQARVLEWLAISFSRGCLPDPGFEPGSPTLQADALPSEPPGKVKEKVILWKVNIYFSNAQKCAFPHHFDFSALKPNDTISSNEALLWLKITGSRSSDNTSYFADQDISSGFQNRYAR